MHWLVSVALLAATPQVIDGLLDAWKTAHVVCLGEDHGRRYDSELRIALVRDPRFPRMVRQIIIESANPVHQDLLDRFALDGEPMIREQLAPIWRDASGAETWESPIYEQFLRAVQEANKKLPRGERVRVIGGDSPIDWSQIKTAEQLAPLVNRGGNIRKIIAEQALDPKIKTLAIYGAGHCEKRGGGFPGELEDRYPGKIWAVSSFYKAAEGRRAFNLGKEPQLLRITGTDRAKMASGKMFYSPDVPLGGLFDAIVYHGDVWDEVVLADLRELDAKYNAELTRRGNLIREALALWLKRK